METSYYTATFNDGETNHVLAFFSRLDDALMFARMKTRRHAGDGCYDVFRMENGEIAQSYVL